MKIVMNNNAGTVDTIL